MALYRPLVLRGGVKAVLGPEDTILGSSFSFRRIADGQAVYIPTGQQHLNHQELIIEGTGELVLQGDAEHVTLN